MMRHLNSLLPLALLALLGLAGCGTTEKARFYTLSLVTASEHKAPLDISVNVNMVNLAQYLNRPQIVTRTSTNEISIGEFDRWAEPLNEAIPRLVAENLSHLLGSPRVATIPWQRSVAPDYVVFFEVIRFDGSVGGDVSLQYMYSVMDVKGKTVFTVERSMAAEPTAGPGYEAVVSAGSRAVAAMSREIAEAIRKNHGR
jgi:uncharacterized lipoprotein YmbA